MSQNKNNYDLNQQLNSAQIGFKLFKAENKQYYFQFYNTEGKATLFSEGYINAASRDNGLKSVKKNAAENLAYNYNRTVEGQFYFTITAGNRQEIARSKNFVSERDMEIEKLFFQENLFVNKKLDGSLLTESVSTNELKEGKENKSVGLQIENADLANDNTILYTEPLRQSFRIDIYPSQNGSIPNGKITYLLDGELNIFTGIDVAHIAEFINSKINPVEKNLVEVTTRSIESNEQALVASKQNTSTMKQTSILASKVSEIEIKKEKSEIQERDEISVEILNAASTQAEIKFTLKSKTNIGESLENNKKQNFQIKAFAYNFERKEHFLMYKQDMEISAKNGELHFAIPSELHTPGSYRISAIASPVVNEKSDPKLHLWSGDVLVQIL